MMSDTRTASMLQRVPVILATTASAYGLNFEAGQARRPMASGDRRRVARDQAHNGGKPSAQR
jgi:hypothetical protein